jgi:hypothetical protein
MNTENYEVQTVELHPAGFDAIEKTSVDIQVATAKMYPRNINRSISNAIAMATMDEKAADTCGYALPRSGKLITGPSVHLAKILASAWGNIRSEAKIIRITDKHIVSRGTCWDLETNVAAAFEVQRSISGKFGRYSDDMITVTGNAANAISYRNAVLAVIPKSVSEKVYAAAQEKITGDLSKPGALEEKRRAAIKYFREEYAIGEADILKLVGKRETKFIGASEIAILKGVRQSIRDGDTTVSELFGKNAAQPAPDERKTAMKETLRNKPKPEMP